jgi:hypothetical protein
MVLLATATAVAAEDVTVQEGVVVAERWLKLIDKGEIKESWATAAESFRQTVTEEQWAREIGKVRKPLGRPIFRKVEVAKYETNLPGAPAGQYVVVLFKVLFEDGSWAVETVTPMKDPDGEWRVAAYLIK